MSCNDVRKSRTLSSLSIAKSCRNRKISLHYLPDANRDNVITSQHASKYDVVPVADALTEGVSSFYPVFEPPERVAAA